MEMTVEVQRAMFAIQSINQKIPDLELRDLFAMSALNGIIGSSEAFFYTSHAEAAYNYADEMLEARKVKK